MDHDTLMTLMTGVFAVLAIASIIGAVLSARVGDGPNRSVVENLNARILAWWVMVALLGLAFYWGRVGVTLLFAVCSFNALREFVTLTNARRADHWMLAAVFFVVLPLQYYLVYIDWYGFYTVLIPVYVFLLMPVLSALRGEVGNFLIRVAEVQWAAMVTIYFVSHVPALLTYDMPDGSDRSVLLIVFFVMVVQFGDLFEYYAGRSFGRRRIAPELSPKTREGMIVGVLAAAGIGALLSWITPFGLLGAAAMAALASVTGMFGRRRVMESGTPDFPTCCSSIAVENQAASICEVSIPASCRHSS